MRFWYVCYAACASGSAAVVKVKVRESVVGDGTAYNGSRIRLFVKSNAIALYVYVLTLPFRR